MAKEKENLESAFKQLEKIIDELNKGNLDIEESLEKFKKGVALIKACREQLKKAENEFLKLKKELEFEENFEEENSL